MEAFVDLCVMTPLNGFQRCRHRFSLQRRFSEQVFELCAKHGWQVDSRRPDAEPVLMHGATGFFVSDMELPRIEATEELRLGSLQEELEKSLRELEAEAEFDVVAIEILAHNARPDSAFLEQLVRRGGLEKLWALKPQISREWEAVLGALCALLGDESAQERLKERLGECRSCPLFELCLHALDLNPTPMSVSYAIGLLRLSMVLGSGAEGLAAIFRSESELRNRSLYVFFVADLVGLAIDNDADAMQFMNDVVALCPRGPLFTRFTEEVLAAVAHLNEEGSFLEVLLDMFAEHRCRRAIVMSVTGNLQLLGQTAGVMSAQAERERATQQEPQTAALVNTSSSAAGPRKRPLSELLRTIRQSTGYASFNTACQRPNGQD